MRKWIANWVAEDYIGRAATGLCIYKSIRRVGTALIVFGAGFMVGAVAPGIVSYVALAPVVGAVFIAYVCKCETVRKFKLRKNPMTVPAETVVSVTDSIVPDGYVEATKVDTSDLSSIVTWADKLIRRNLCVVLNKNIHIPRRTCAVVLVDNEKARSIYESVHEFPRPELHSYYNVTLDVALVGIDPVGSSLSKARYDVLNEMVSRYTRDVNEHTYVVCILAYLSDDVGCFLYARDAMLKNPKATDFWPSYLPKAGWLEQ